jgi:hypothetical protein
VRYRIARYRIERYGIARYRIACYIIEHYRIVCDKNCALQNYPLKN